MSTLTHLDEQGAARMVDVSGKAESLREATARGAVHMQPATLKMIADGSHPKGDVFAVARVAGIMAAKKTPELIPLCHPLHLDSVRVGLTAHSDPSRVEIDATVRVRGSTGVEMEALAAVATAALTVYDMCKAADRGMQITNLRLVRKSGGRSGAFEGA